MSSKVLIIKSPTHFWTLLKSREEIYENNNVLRRFMFLTDKYIKGCQCGADNALLMNTDYRLLSQNNDIIALLKNEFCCDSVIFENN